MSALLSCPAFSCQFGFSLSPSGVSGYVKGGLTLFTFSLDVWVGVSPGSFDFELRFALLPKFYLDLAVHASIPLPVIKPTDPVGSINSVARFDPSKASFSVSAGADLSGLTDLLLGPIQDCKPILEQVLKAAQAAYDIAKKESDAVVAAYDRASQVAAKAVMAAQATFDRVIAGVDRQIAAANRAVDLALSGVQMAEQKAQQLVSTASQVGQRGVDQANEALQRARQFGQAAVARAEQAVTNALNALKQLFTDHPHLHLQSYSHVRPPVQGTRRLLGWLSDTIGSVTDAVDDVAEEAKNLAEEALALEKEAAQAAVSHAAARPQRRDGWAGRVGH